jgi:hypothetical protein
MRRLELRSMVRVRRIESIYRADTVALASHRALMSLARASWCQEGFADGHAGNDVSLALVQQVGVFMTALNGLESDDERLMEATVDAIASLTAMAKAGNGWCKALAHDAMDLMCIAPEVYALSGREQVGTSLIYIRNRAR